MSCDTDEVRRLDNSGGLPAHRKLPSRIASMVLLTAAIAFCWHSFANQWSTVEASWRTVSWRVLIVSGVLGTNGFLLFPVCVWELYGGLEKRRPRLLPLSSAYFIANIFKYVPGKVLTFAVLVNDSCNQGLSRKKMAQAFIGSVGLSVAVSVGCAVCVLGPTMSESPWTVFASVAVGLVALSVVHPRTNARLMAIGLRVVRRSNVDVYQFRLMNLIQATLLMIVAWFMLGVSFSVVASGLVAMTSQEFLLCALVYPAAFTAGVLTVFAPAGIGVREGILVAFLVQQVTSFESGGVTVAVLVVVTHRVLMTIIDAVFLLIGLAGRNFLAAA